jgi:hypothetical protein
MPKAMNYKPGTCKLEESQRCTVDVPARAGVYLRGAVICRNCVARVMRDIYQDGPCARRDYRGVPTMLIRWAARQNRIQKEEWRPLEHG